MNRSITILIALVLAALVPAKVAFAQDAPPTKDQIEQAKKAFGEGKQLFEDGKFPEAAAKFKESYKLSRNPILLYNIGHTFDQMGDKDHTLFYFRQFLADAPKTATQRKDVEKRVKEIEKQKLDDDLNGTTAPPPNTNTNTQTQTPPPNLQTQPQGPAKPAGTYKATDFQTQVVDSAPPGKPLDVTAVVPKDSGWSVTLYYRGMGDTKWIAKPMRWRYNELVARIPGNKIGGSTIQYYIDAKDASGTMIARSGKSTSPNLVNVDATVAPRFYPDFTDEETGTTQTAIQQHNEGEEDPLHPRAHPEPQPNLNVNVPVDNGMGNGMGAQEDLNPNKYSKKKWVATGIAGGLLGLAVLTYVLAARQSSNLSTDSTSTMAGMPCMSPCHTFDKYDVDVEKAGKSMNTYNTLTTLTGVIAGSVAVYFWYKEHQLKKRLKAGGGSPSNDAKPAAPAAPAHDEFSLVPAIGEGFAGAAAVGRF